jgi:hypothetical protein
VREPAAQGRFRWSHHDHHELISGGAVKRQATGFISELPTKH